MYYKKTLGHYGEKLALQYYQKLHYELIAQNYYSRYGELDLVFKKNQKITVVEVKTRSTNKFLWAEESIDYKKINRLTITYAKLAKERNLPPFFDLEALIIQIKNKKAKIIRYKL